MASVTEMKGDDVTAVPFAEPQFKQHFMYCDACGSFEIVPWTGPEDAPQLPTVEKRWRWLGAALGVLGCVLLALTVCGAPLAPALVVLVAAAIAFGATFYVGSRITVLGARCASCDARYHRDGEFFVFRERNPRNYTLDDVPRPLERNYRLRTFTREGGGRIGIVGE